MSKISLNLARQKTRFALLSAICGSMVFTRPIDDESMEEYKKAHEQKMEILAELSAEDHAWAINLDTMNNNPVLEVVKTLFSDIYND